MPRPHGDRTPWTSARRGVHAVLGLVIGMAAVVAVLIHHNAASASATWTAAVPAHPATASHHGMGSMVHSSPMAMNDEELGCSTSPLVHCASADVDRFTPTQPQAVGRPDRMPDAPGFVTAAYSARAERAPPPELSLLSRLRI